MRANVTDQPYGWVMVLCPEDLSLKVSYAAVTASQTPSHLKEFAMTHKTDIEFENLSPRLQRALEKIATIEDSIDILFIHEDEQIRPFILGEEIED